MTLLRVNGREVEVEAPPIRRLSEVLRDDLGLTGTKVGCDAGDCGACTVRLDGEAVCACLVAVGQLDGREVSTVEGLARDGELAPVQAAFIRHGGAQCGICTPGMLMAADALLSSTAKATESEVMDALGGVLCRCTGYRKIVDAITSIDGVAPALVPPTGEAVGARVGRVDGIDQVTGASAFGADRVPTNVLHLRAIRSPHHHARFTIGDLAPLYAAHPGLARVLVAADVPGRNRYGIYATGKDQPALADDYVRYRGEAVAALVGDAAAVASIRDEDLPIAWDPLEPLLEPEVALGGDAPRLHEGSPGNVLTAGRVARGDVTAALGQAAVTATGTFRTGHVEHAYIEPEAGYAERHGDRMTVVASTQTPYMDRDEVALVLGIAPEDVRIVPTACGGGFGGKLDMAVQPLVAVAAWVLGRPVRCVYTRPESMRSTTKRHPAVMTATLGADVEGRFTAFDFHGDFDTGAYASWGPTVANRVPVHAAGPYEVGAVRATTRAIHTNGPICGAFRGFGANQAQFAMEGVLDRGAGR